MQTWFPSNTLQTGSPSLLLSLVSCMFFDGGQPAANDPLSLSNDTLLCNPGGGRTIKDCDWWWEGAFGDGSGSGYVVTHCAGQLTLAPACLTHNNAHTCVYESKHWGWWHPISLSTCSLGVSAGERKGKIIFVFVYMYVQTWIAFVSCVQSHAIRL